MELQKALQLSKETFKKENKKIIQIKDNISSGVDSMKSSIMM